jgi:uncharacterized RDD family membrane protein YckC
MGNAIAQGSAGTLSIRRRMASLVYEALLLFGMLLLPGMVGAVVFAVTGKHNDAILPVLTFVLYGAYFVWFWCGRGQTLPMQTWHIYLVTAKGGHKPSVARAIARYVAGYGWVAPAAALVVTNHWNLKQSLVAFVVGLIAYALLALLHPERQFWHDVLSGTRLVNSSIQPKR